MPGLAGNGNLDQGWWSGGSGTFSGSTLGNFFYESSGDKARNEFNLLEAQKARDFNSAEAARAREFELYMSNTAHQRAVADMKAAGINPMMAAGSSAAVGNGAAASASGASSSASGNPFASIVGRAAATAIGKGLEAKFTNSAQKAADNHDLVTAKIKALAAQEQKALTASGVDLSKSSDSKQESMDIIRFLKALTKL